LHKTSLFGKFEMFKVKLVSPSTSVMVSED
jgi:hypothetical protein